MNGPTLRQHRRSSAPSTSRRSRKNLARMVEEGGKALAAYMKPREEGQIEGELSDEIDRRGQDARPGRRILAVRSAARGRTAVAASASAYLDLWARAVKRLAGEETEPVVAPDPKDKRFADPEWSSEPVLRFPQAGLSAHHATGPTTWSKDAEGPRPAHPAEGRVLRQADRQRAVAVEFRADQSGAAARDARRPTPRTWRAACTCWPRTSQAGGGDLKIRQSDAAKFEVGRNLARHARQGDLPERADAAHPVRADDAETVLKRPLLIVPPWINKFYVLDLTPEKSFINWCVDQGLTVFVISWVNPDERLAKKSFEDYMREGPLAALDAIEQATGEKQGPRHRLLRRRHAAVDHARLHGGQGRRPHRVGDAVRRAGRFHPRRRPQGVRRRGAARGARAADGRARLSRRQARWPTPSTCCARTT